MAENNKPELYSEEQLKVLEDHIEKNFGHCENVFHEIYSPDIHVDIYIVKPEDSAFGCYELITLGAGAHIMNVPEEYKEMADERIELQICLPPDWDINSEDEEYYWPIRMLKYLARLPITEDSWLGWGHSIDVGCNVADNTELCGAILLSVPNGEEAGECDLPDGNKVHFYSVFPVYENEMKYKIDYGTGKLLDLFGTWLSPIVDPDRPCVASYTEETIMDRQEWHIPKIRQNDFELDELCGVSHMAMYLRWCMEHDLMDSDFADFFEEEINAVKEGRPDFDLREFIMTELGGFLTREMFSEEGAAFAEYYYVHGRKKSQPCYPHDVDRYALSWFGEEKYNCEEFNDEAYLFLPYDDTYYRGMSEYIDKYYARFRKKNKLK